MASLALEVTGDDEVDKVLSIEEECTKPEIWPSEKWEDRFLVCVWSSAKRLIVCFD